ncbi:MAG: glycoside hydrolase family 3 N-terminal domain-containing protein [Anaerolineae bacterium]|nr:glycoside hydrolase family 3 N-terminal domain-containing protein [Anaerolineae bacterium]
MNLLWRLTLVTVLLAGMLALAPARAAQEPSAAELLEQMTVAERVGQLFLVTFEGDDPDQEAMITDLVLNYHVGGVVLSAAHDNIRGNGEETATAVARLTNRLQHLALEGDSTFATRQITATGALTPTLVPAVATPVAPADGVRLPLFIATAQEGDGPPYSQLFDGLTPLPSPMAIGATWQPSLAEDVGEIVGRELAAIGINMLLGPSLDVLEEPQPSLPSDLGVRSFGGDPYWVGLMGRGYTTGVHQGSDGSVAVIAKHFPGQGSSDRPLGDEVSTVRKSLSQLKQVELAPFVAVTGLSPSPEAMVDGLLTTHIRYQGFQGNIRATTAPVSFDPQALQSLLAEPEFTLWRQNGGLVVSDALGVRAVQRFYDDTGQTFPHRRIAKDALVAGNDLLYLGDYAQDPNDWRAQYANMADTVVSFQARYETDLSFRARVDEALLRILELKLRLYSHDFSPENVFVEPQVDLGRPSSAPVRVAQEAITLIAPSQAELAERLPGPPTSADNIIIFTDVRTARQCRGCPPEEYIGQRSLEERLLALYGPESSNQIREEQIRSFTYSDLADFIAAGPAPIAPPDEDEATPGTPAPFPAAFAVQSALQEADWIVFAMLDVKASVPASSALKDFLAQRQDIIRSSRIIVFAYNAPYFLDTTEISKLTAYYGVYSKIPAFIDTTARILFQEIPVRGASPVDVRDTGYRLAEVTQPDPDQVIPVGIVRDGAVEYPSVEAPLELQVGDNVRLRAGVIVDHNGRPVPDGTPVQFFQEDRTEGLITLLGESPTRDGVAELDYVLEDRTGQFRITAQSVNARSSQQLDIVIGERVQFVMITPTPAPTATPTPSPTPTSTPTPTPTLAPTAAPSPTVTPLPPEPRLEITLGDFQRLLGLVSGLVLTMVAGWIATRQHSLSRRVRLVTAGLAGALLLYNYYVLGLPGADSLSALSGWAALLTTLSGGLAGLAVSWAVLFQLHEPR